MCDVLRLIHISDIHFADEGIWFDHNRDVRRELRRDAADVTGDESVDAILISGDIAYSGLEGEYERAYEWLEGLCEELGVGIETVFVVPGNHDIDRSVIRTSRTLRLIHQDIRTQALAEGAHAAGEAIGEILEEGRDIFRPLSAYNKFARRFGCEFSQDRAFWESDFHLNDGSILRMRGLNSTLVSDDSDDEGENRLVLGVAQVDIPNISGVEYLTVCHHPPSWMFDRDVVNDRLYGRAKVQLFGHRHRDRGGIQNGCFRAIAGASSPPRGEVDWDPRYNLLSLEVVSEPGARRLIVSVESRAWREEAQGYSRYSDDRYSLDLDGWDSDRASAIPAGENLTEPAMLREQSGDSFTERDVVNQGDGDGETEDELNGGDDVDLQVGEEEERTLGARRLVVEFYSLSYRQRMEIVGELNLIRDEDETMSEEARNRAYFRRAARLGRLPEFRELVARAGV